MNKFFENIKEMLLISVPLAKAEFKLRNEGSYLGILWYLLNPILTFSVLYFIFANRLGNNIPYYFLYLLIGIVMFNFFSSSTGESTGMIIRDYFGLMKSINFPRESLLIAILLKNFFSHSFEILLLAIFLVFFKINLLYILFYIPIFFFFLIFIFGLSLVLSSLAAYIVDINNVWSFLLSIIWLGTPVFYAIGGQTKLFYVNLASPLYYFMTIARDVIIYNKMPAWWLIFGSIGYSLIFLIAGLFLFNKLKGKFTELI